MTTLALQTLNVFYVFFCLKLVDYCTMYKIIDHDFWMDWIFTMSISHWIVLLPLFFPSSLLSTTLHPSPRSSLLLSFTQLPYFLLSSPLLSSPLLSSALHSPPLSSPPFSPLLSPLPSPLLLSSLLTPLHQDYGHVPLGYEDLFRRKQEQWTHHHHHHHHHHGNTNRPSQSSPIFTVDFSSEVRVFGSQKL